MRKRSKERRPHPPWFGPDRVVVVRRPPPQKGGGGRRRRRRHIKKGRRKRRRIANGIERAARFVLVFSAHGHVARHERRRGHVLFICIIIEEKNPKRFKVSDTLLRKGQYHHANPPPRHTRERERQKENLILYIPCESS